ncbi:unnamed protein product, partial [marine sediment metagenome]
RPEFALKPIYEVLTFYMFRRTPVSLLIYGYGHLEYHYIR